MLLVLVPQELFLGEALLFCLQPLLLLEFSLSLLLGEGLLPLSFLPLLLESALLIFILLLLSFGFVGPEVADRFRFGRRELGRWCWFSLDLLCGALRKSWPFVVLR